MDSISPIGAAWLDSQIGRRVQVRYVDNETDGNMELIGALRRAQGRRNGKLLLDSGDIAFFPLDASTLTLLDVQSSDNAANVTNDVSHACHECPTTEHAQAETEAAEIKHGERRTKGGRKHGATRKGQVKKTVPRADEEDVDEEATPKNTTSSKGQRSIVDSDDAYEASAERRSKRDSKKNAKEQRDKKHEESVSKAAAAVKAAMYAYPPELTCLRCRKGPANEHAIVPIRSIYLDGCSHGPFCEDCKNKLQRLVLPMCACRALIGGWSQNQEGIVAETSVKMEAEACS